MNLEDLDIDDQVELEVPKPSKYKSFFTKSKEEDKILEDKKKKEKKKGKTFWEKVFNPKKLEKPNKVAVIYLRNNARAEAMILEPKRGFFTIKGKTHNEDKDCIYSLGKDRLPFAVIHEDRLLPEGTKKWYERSIQEICLRVQNHVMKGIRHAELVRSGEKDISNVSMKQIIMYIILAIIAGAIIMNFA